MKKIKITSILLAALLSAGTLISSCAEDRDGEYGTLSLNLTDAPTDAENIAGVYVTFTGVEYRMEGDDWQSFEKFSGPQTINLLELTEGKTTLMGDFPIEAGTYTGLRFKLDAAENGGNASGEATYLEFKDGSREPLFVPGGTKSGYKAIGNFTVPVNGFVAITADFDVRKSVVEAGKKGKYLLKPVIRIIANNQAGTINGNFSGYGNETGAKLIVYAYETGKYSETEMAEPAEEEIRFPNAVSSTGISDDGSFVLPFLAPGGYDLVIVSYLEGAFEKVVKVIPSAVVVKSTETTETEIIF